MKKIATLLASTLLLAGLAGCADTNNNNNANEGAAGLNYNNDVREINQRAFGVNDFDENRMENRKYRYNDSRFDGREYNAADYGRGVVGNDRPGMVDKDGVLNRKNEHRNFAGKNVGNNVTRRLEGRYGYNFPNDYERIDVGKTDSDYRGKSFGKGKREHFQGQRINNGNVRGYFDGKDGRLSQEISKSLAGVRGLRDSHVIVHENDVIIGVEHDGDEKDIDRDIRNRIKDRVGNRNVHVVTDREHVNDIRGLNRRLENGEPFEALGEAIDDILDNIGDAVQRPFERTR